MNRFINKEHRMTNAVTALVVAMIILVVAVVFWVCIDSYANRQYREKVNAKLDSIQSVAFNAQDLLKESSDTLNIEALEDLLEAKIDAAIIEEKSSAIDSNNYMALILTLVTLCVSLSAVIPYIVGKSISKYEIKNVVEELYAKDKHDVSVKYRESVNMLLASEAHLSRMTAYELLTFYKLQNKACCLNNLDLKKHPIWVIGWASKALIRYITSCNKKNKDLYKTFVADLITYIEEASNFVKSNKSVYENDEMKEGVKRSFLDLLNAIVYNETMYRKLIEADQNDTLRTHLALLYDIVAQKYQNIDVEAEAMEKSHYQVYLDVRQDQDQFRNCLRNEVSNLS